MSNSKYSEPNFTRNGLSNGELEIKIRRYYKKHRIKCNCQGGFHLSELSFDAFKCDMPSLRGGRLTYTVALLRCFNCDDIDYITIIEE